MTKYLLPVLLTLLVGLMNSDVVKKRDRNDYNRNPYRIVCYFSSSSHYHKVDPFAVEDIDHNLCTHINYGFAELNEKNNAIEIRDNNSDYDRNNYKKFNELRKMNPHLTTMIALGGFTDLSEKYSNMSKNPKLMESFVKSVVTFLGEYDFDGLNIDWEFPGSRGGDERADKKDFISLLSELKKAFEPHGYVLTADVSSMKRNIDVGYAVPEINKLVDWINVMTYDYHGDWEDTLGHNAPLYRRPEEVDQMSVWFNINSTINYWIQLGIQTNKIVMGIPFYGRGWTLMNPSAVKLHDPANGASPPGAISGIEGVLGYNEICQLVDKHPHDWVHTYDPYYRAPYSYNKEIWVGYDNVESISCKLAFIKNMNLSGGMIWALETDDFKDRCGGGKYPLLNKVHSMLNGIEKDLYECDLDPHKPSTPGPIPTAPQYNSTTKKARNTPTPVPPFPTITPTTDSPINCTKVGYFPHPSNIHKYIECEYIPEGPRKGWWVHIEDCSLGTRWSQEIKTCIAE